MAGASEAKLAAAVAAVRMYLSQARTAATGGLAPAPHAPEPSPWARYGRQALMNQRIRMQARRRA
jgi:hypothetical protein